MPPPDLDELLRRMHSADPSRSTQLERNSMKRRTPLLDKDGREFTYALPDEVLRGIDEVKPCISC